MVVIRQKTVATLTLLAILAGCFSTLGVAASGNANTKRHTQCDGTIEGDLNAANGPLAQRLAKERFQLLKYAADKLGVLPLSSMVGDYSWTVLFPIGRSDRMYLDIQAPYGMKTGVKGDYLIFCYQRKDGKNKLVYRISIQGKDRLAVTGKTAEPEQFSSLLDYITQESAYSMGEEHHVTSYSLPAGTSLFARDDLRTKRDYVIYEYLPVIDTLEVRLLSVADKPTMYALYSEDPKTGIQDPVKVYKKYGLPVSQQELARVGGKRR